MYLIYVDESGTLNVKDSSKFYVLSSIIVHEYNWVDINEKIDQLKVKHFPKCNPVDFEFHMSDITHKKGVFKQKSKSDLFIIIRDIFTLISTIDCTIICIAMIKEQIGNPKKIEHISLKYLLERFERNLEEKNKDKQNKDLGLIIMDGIERSVDFGRLKTVREVRREFNAQYKKETFLIEDPVFVDSHYRSLIQLADAIAFCVQRTFQESNEKTDLFKECFELIKDKFAVNSKGEIEGAGLKIFPTEKDRKRFLKG